MGHGTHNIADRVIPWIYGRRRLTFVFLLLVTGWLAIHAALLKPDAGFEKTIPLQHPYMQVFKQYQGAFGGANLISIALVAKDGDIYNEVFLDRLKRATDEVFFTPGVDRSRVQSLFTPGVRYIEVVEGGFSVGDVIPRNYAPAPEMFERIRSNTAKAGVIGRLVSNDQRGALIVAELLEHDPITGEALDYHAVSQKLEVIRQRFQDAQIQVHIIGFAKVVGDVTDASVEVASFFILALIMTLLLLWSFCGSFRLSLLPLLAAVTAVIWELGLLQLLGYGLDPFAILVPFLILSIGVSHGVQYINYWGHEVAVEGHDPLAASIATFRRLFLPGTVAILTNVIGFATLAFIQIEIVHEMAINAALGMAAVIVTNKVMLPIVLSWVAVPDVEKFRRRQRARVEMSERIWQRLADFTLRPHALATLVLATAALGWALWKYPDLRIGDTQVGVPELRPDSRYNQDSRAISEHFAIGVDVLQVMAEAEPYACVSGRHMEILHDYSWRMQNTPGVASVASLPLLATVLNGKLNEGLPRLQVLPRNRAALASLVGGIPSSAGLQNPDCSVMPILIFATDHRAETIETLIAATQQFNEEIKGQGIHLALAGGNLGVMAATNEEIRARELVVIIWVHLTLLVFVWLTFRTVTSVICIIVPLVLCSLLTYGGMAVLGIGMKAATLPVAAFGVGIGVDDGIYLWSMLQTCLNRGLPLRQAFLEALRTTGRAVCFTSFSLMVAVFTWLFSELQFQQDMGLLLLFMFGTNLLGALLLLPALAWLCFAIRPHVCRDKMQPQTTDL